MKIVNRWTTGLFTAVIITAGSLGISTLANDGETTEATTTIATTEATTQPREKIVFEYYTITEEALKNGWTCHTIDRCDKNKVMVYIYDPAILGQHKFNVIAGFKFIQGDFVVVYIDQYGETLGTETFTMKVVGSGFALVINTAPPGTKYVKFADLTNIIYPE